MFSLFGFVAFFAVFTSSQRAPSIPSTFSANGVTQLIYTTSNGENATLTGKADYTSDEEAKMHLYDERIDSSEHDYFEIYRLERWDQGKAYEILHGQSTGCNVTLLTGSISSPWAWVASAQFHGAQVFRGKLTDFWSLSEGNVTREVGVLHVGPSFPIVFIRSNRNTRATHTFVIEYFNPKKPKPVNFQVPSQCRQLPISSPRANK